MDKTCFSMDIAIESFHHFKVLNRVGFLWVGRYQPMKKKKMRCPCCHRCYNGTDIKMSHLSISIACLPPKYLPSYGLEWSHIISLPPACLPSLRTCITIVRALTWLSCQYIRQSLVHVMHEHGSGLVTGLLSISTWWTAPVVGLSSLTLHTSPSVPIAQI